MVTNEWCKYQPRLIYGYTRERTLIKRSYNRTWTKKREASILGLMITHLEGENV
jgi:hypothetical protein